MKKISKLIVGVFCAVLLATSAFAANSDCMVSSMTTVTTVPAPAPAPVTSTPLFGDWVFTVSGIGATTTADNSQTAFGLSLSAGRELSLFGTKDEVGIRQSVAYASGDGENTIASTRLYGDVTVFCFDLTQNIPVDIYVGANFGPTYGDTSLLWVAAPEAGVDVWLAPNVALDARIDYAFDLNHGRSEDI